MGEYYFVLVKLTCLLGNISGPVVTPSHVNQTFLTGSSSHRPRSVFIGGT